MNLKLSTKPASRAQPVASRRRFLAAGLGAGMAGIAGIAGCARPETALRIGSVVFPGYEFMFLAREMGILDDSRVRLVELQSNSDTLRALAAHQLDGAALNLDELLMARANGIALRVVLIMDASIGANAVMAHAPVDLQHLEGRRIGVEDSAMGGVMLTALLQAAGLQANQVSVVSVRLDRTEEVFRLGAVDAVITAEPWAARIGRTGGRRIFDSAALPDRIFDVLAVRPEALENHADAVRYLIEGHFAAQDLFQKEPQAAYEWMAPRLQIDPAEVANVYYGLQLPTVAQNRDWLRPNQWHLAGSLVQPNSAWGDWVDPRFLPL